MASLIPRSNSLKVPINAARKRSGSFSESVGLSRSLSTERPGTPRPVDMEAFGNVDASNCGFRKSRQFFGSMDSLSSRHCSGGSFLTPMPKSSISTQIARSFSTLDQVDTRIQESVDIEVTSTESIIAKTLNPEEIQRMRFYSKFTPTSVTLSHFLDHSSGGGTVEDSFLFLRREIPVRLANMIMELEELPQELLSQQPCQDIIANYGQSFKDVVQFENIPNTPESHELFNNLLSAIRQRHQDTIPRMADALHSLREEGKLNVSNKDRMNLAIQYVLDRLYLSRISIHLLISQHKAQYCPEESKGANTGMQGTIDPSCDAADVAREAFANAAFLCDQMYMDSPKLKLTCINQVDDTKDKVNFVYIPNHLYHMCFELFKNSMRATMETWENADEIPDIEVQIVKSKNDISIKVSDQGGGINRNINGNIFLYLFTSATRVKLNEGDMGGTTGNVTPMHGLGYGLPLSRLYARYFGGDIQIQSMDGHGTDAFVYLKTLETNARENLPIFNTSSVSKIKDIKNQVPDWTNVNQDWNI
jgi:pyruvate dehydrogenase kinase 2/3/4